MVFSQIILLELFAKHMQLFLIVKVMQVRLLLKRYVYFIFPLLIKYTAAISLYFFSLSFLHYNYEGEVQEHYTRVSDTTHTRSALNIAMNCLPSIDDDQISSPFTVLTCFVNIKKYLSPPVVIATPQSFFLLKTSTISIVTTRTEAISRHNFNFKLIKINQSSNYSFFNANLTSI